MVQIEILTKIPRERLRPDLYRTKCKGDDDGADQQRRKIVKDLREKEAMPIDIKVSKQIISIL